VTPDPSRVPLPENFVDDTVRLNPHVQCYLWRDPTILGLDLLAPWIGPPRDLTRAYDGEAVYLGSGAMRVLEADRSIGNLPAECGRGMVLDPCTSPRESYGYVPPCSTAGGAAVGGAPQRGRVGPHRRAMRWEVISETR